MFLYKQLFVMSPLKTERKLKKKNQMYKQISTTTIIQSINQLNTQCTLNIPWKSYKIKRKCLNRMQNFKSIKMTPISTHQQMWNESNYRNETKWNEMKIEKSNGTNKKKHSIHENNSDDNK